MAASISVFCACEEDDGEERAMRGFVRKKFAIVELVRMGARRVVIWRISGVVGKSHMTIPWAPWLMLSIVMTTSSAGVG